MQGTPVLLAYPDMAAMPAMDSKRPHLLMATTSALALAGLLGTSLHASQLLVPTPPPSGGGSSLNVLLASLLAFFAGEALWVQLGGEPLARGAYARRCRLACTALPLLVVPTLALLFIIGYRLDAAAWCVPLFLALLLPARTQLRWAAEGAAAPLPTPLSPRLLTEEGGAAAEGPEQPAAPPAPASAPAALQQCCCPAGARPLQRAAFFAHSGLWCAAVVTLTLLLGGAGTIAAGWRRYAHRGALYSLPDIPARVHAWCTGPPAPTTRGGAPTIWLEVGGGGHSSSDTYGLQFALNAAGRRVCTSDPPGTAWSPLLASAAPSAAAAAQRMRALMAAMGEPGPFVLVGTMDDGAERIYEFALAYPALVSALVPMQYGIAEFTAKALRSGWDPVGAQAQAYAVAQVRPRLAMCQLITFLGVPWGLMPLLVPRSATFVPADAQDECHFLNLEHEGQWDMQCRYLAAQLSQPRALVAPSAWQSNRSLSASIPVLALANVPRDVCAPAGLAGEECAVAALGAALNLDFMRNMTSMSAGSVFLNACAEDGLPVCKEWLGSGASVPFVRDSILAYLGNLSRPF